jgi:hypothetical protein
VRILALYDIHGNPDALDAVLADSRAAGADGVVVGGDAVPGAFGARVLGRLAALRYVAAPRRRDAHADLHGRALV